MDGDPAYDARGNLSRYDNDAYGPWTYEYDQLNRLTSLSIGAATVNYSYDPLGRIHLVDPPGTNNDRRYVWNGSQVALELAGTSGGTISERYVHDQGSLGAPLAIFTGSALTQANMTYLLTDERGSVIAFVDGADGEVTHINSYGPYGEFGANTISPFGYAGQLAFPEAEIVYIRNRLYHPALGRFLQTDPIGWLPTVPST